MFDSTEPFPERWGEERFYRGEGVFIPTREQRHMWETNLIPNVLTFDQMTPSPHRGAGSMNIQFVLGETTMRGHISEVGVGNYKMAHIHGDGAAHHPAGRRGLLAVLARGRGAAPGRLEVRDAPLTGQRRVASALQRQRPTGPLPAPRLRRLSLSRSPTPIAPTSFIRTFRRARSRSSTRTRIRGIRQLFDEERAKWSARHGVGSS